MNNYVCLICGYVHIGDEPPEKCPVCDAPKEMFELKGIDKPVKETDAFKCLNCEYIHHGNEAPDVCPVCGLSKEHFEAVEDKVYSLNKVDFKSVVILGGGIAALSAAETIRSMNTEVGITMITGEEKLPYYRLNLTRYLCDDIDESELCIHSQYWYDEKHIQVFKNRVIINIDRDNQKILLNDDVEVTYDKLIIALGSHAFVPPITGASSEGIYSLRSIEDAKDLKEVTKDGTKVFIIGGGVLGLEAAGALNKNGGKVTVGEGSKWLMPRQLNEASSRVLAESIVNSGIAIEYDFRTTSIEKNETGFIVTAKDGRVIETDVIILATGVRPNTYLARKAELEVNRGIVVNDHLMTSDPNIYAIGDISEHYGSVYGLWNIAQYQGKVAAMNLLGDVTDFGEVPRSNALKVLDIDVFSIGTISPEDGSYEMVEKAEPNKYLMFIIHNGRVVGSIAIGYESITHKIKKFVESNDKFGEGKIDSIDHIIELL